MTVTIHPSRRRFLAGAGGLAFAVLSGGGISVLRPSAQAATSTEPGVPVDAWVTIFPDDRVIIRYGAAEMGQGVSTSLPLIVAEELDADWDRVTVEQVSQDPQRLFGNPAFGGNLFSAGSTSLEGYFTALRIAGATARRVLIHTAAAAWGLPVDEVSTEPGVVVHEASGRRLRFGEIVALEEIRTDVLQVFEDDLKPREAWRLIGSGVGRRDIPGKTRGEAIYSIDVRVDGMVYAAQLLAPVEGEAPTVDNDADALSVPGVIAVVPLANSIGVVADTFEAALAGRDRLRVSWSTGSDFRSADSADELAQLAQAADDFSTEPVTWEARGDAAGALSAEGRRTVTAHYTTEHVYHAQMEPLNAVASVDHDGKGADVWVGSQSQTISLAVASHVLDTTPDRIRFHAMQMGGAFGRRTVFARDLLRDALLLSKTVGRPVKLIWTREDDVKNGWLRPATVHRLDAVLDETGRLEALRHRVASPSIMQFAFPNRWDPESRRDLLVMEGTESADYAIPNLLAEQVLVDRRSRVSAWRGIGWAPNCFARECFLDELADAAGSDPVSFRRDLLRDSPRGLEVLNKVVKMSGFGNPPEGRAHGLAFAGYKATLGAGVAEVSVTEGRLRVHRFWAAVDPGIVVHPLSYVGQVEGGIIFGLSSLLGERSTFTDGMIEQNNFYDYEILRIDAVPEIEVALVESGSPPSGGGEIGVPMTGGAVANAVRRLTGTQPRRMPFDLGDA
ncbi:xanthine dehydrogenase family protein molybdopterin-binding subunit [Thalassobaculum litoreum]|uniref:Isoquinoline 1-oxidoreductase, beta subunit n=1 Tax=Thalassobaculum litoreum DSM 18839 TaxID=1123362 RepID=A0A8G2BK83_9PROT|nr:molybdopterin cofactor-binding domain-containing protein [Thalassobaculum litoreum]SDG17287.1 isoquinoline 1-oxidoreductase, beta subunit [Thalassobaculum litoreum DSM 18839]